MTMTALLDGSTLNRPVPRAPLEQVSAVCHRPRPSIWSRIAVVCTLVTIGVVHAVNIGGFPRFFDDEGTYVSQAWAARHGALAPYTYWYDHPPVGWLQLAPLSWLTDVLVAGPDVLASRMVMVAYTVVSAFLVYLLARRIGMRQVFAIAAMALWGLSPLVVSEGRQVLLDNIALPWILGAFLLASSSKKSLMHHTMAGLIFAIGVLTKETFIILAPALAAAIWFSGYRATRAFALTGFGICTALTGGFYILFALIRDELLPGPGHVSLWDALAWQTFKRGGSGFLLDPSSGAHGILRHWLSIDSVLVIAGVGAALIGLADRRLRPIALAASLITALALRPDGYLPFMYVIGALPFFALAIAGVADRIWSRVATRHWATRVLGAGLLAAAALAVAPGWISGNAVALTADQNSDYNAALAYVKATLPRDSVVVSDNSFWNDLVSAGWAPGWGAVWFYKVDLDPAFLVAHPDGWRAVDYIVGSRGDFFWGNAEAKPVFTEAYENSTVVASFGAIEVRAVQDHRVVAGEAE